MPTRDVTNTRRKGNKIEPHLEKMMENWCKCRARFVTANVKKALQGIGGHCMVLTTNHPVTEENFAVGVLYFSRTRYERFKSRYPIRWAEKDYLPYVGTSGSKLVSFSDAFRLQPWMNANRKKYLPGKRYGIVNGESHLLEEILEHFTGVPNQIAPFLTNIRHLETILKRDDRDGWRVYWNSKRGVTYNSSACTVRANKTSCC